MQMYILPALSTSVLLYHLWNHLLTVNCRSKGVDIDDVILTIYPGKLIGNTCTLYIYKHEMNAEHGQFFASCRTITLPRL